MSDNCCTSGGEVMLLACSGGSNVGQLSNQAAVELTQEGFGKMFCLAGVGGELTGFVQSAKDVAEMVVIDGCSVGCAKAIFEKAGIALKNYVVITDEDIEKNKDFNLQRADIDSVKKAVRKSMEKSRKPRQSPGMMPFAGGCGCSCKG
ncbi:MAG: putative zinc-binding protein [Desulfopila sp.]